MLIEDCWAKSLNEEDILIAGLYWVWPSDTSKPPHLLTLPNECDDDINICNLNNMGPLYSGA